MSSTLTANARMKKIGSPDAIRHLWQELEVHLDEQRNQIYTEIHNYPPPIPACDQQFNYLLEQRTQVNQEWRQLQEILAEESPAIATAGALYEFMETSTFVGETVKRQIYARLPPRSSKQ